jgi:hypothetical protein
MMAGSYRYLKVLGLGKSKRYPAARGVRKNVNDWMRDPFSERVCEVHGKYFLTPIDGFERRRCHTNFPEVRISEVILVKD